MADTSFSLVMLGIAATVAIAIIHGATIVRVHDVAEIVQVVRVAQAIRDGTMDADPTTATERQNEPLLATFSQTKGKA